MAIINYGTYATRSKIPPGSGPFLPRLSGETGRGTGGAVLLFVLLCSIFVSGFSAGDILVDVVESEEEGLELFSLIFHYGDALGSCVGIQWPILFWLYFSLVGVNII